jgi:hypothetical protein
MARKDHKMIGDALFDCVESLDHYLANYEWPEEVEARVRQLRKEIKNVQKWIDSCSAECLGNVRQRDSRPPFIVWMEANGLGRAEQSGRHRIFRSDNRTN